MYSKKFYRLFIYTIFLSTSLLQAQTTYTLSGYVRESSSGEELIGVNIVIPEINSGTSSNTYGYYSISLPAGKYKVLYQYIGFQTLEKEIDLNRNIVFNAELRESSTELKEVEVSDEAADQNVSSVEMSVAKLSSKDIQRVPQLLGETDIIRTLTLLPGITTVGEGSNGFNVRGGATDQNLILLDEAPVYNSSHLFGFFSIFNADAVKDVKLYKGGIPANYGGRLSSVVDVHQKDGNSKKFTATGGLGLLSSRLLLEGPIKKEKASFMVAARRSYIDLFLRLSDDPTVNQNILYFYDVNAKFNWRISDKDRIFLSGYFGRDVFGIVDLFGFDWGNTTSSLRWNHIYNEKLFSNLSLIYSNYNYSLGTPEDDDISFRLTSRIKDYHLKNNFTYYLNPKHTVDFGAELIAYDFKPGTLTGFQNMDLQKEYAFNPNIYISLEQKVATRWTLQYGLRYSAFLKLGKQKSLNYLNPDFPKQEEVLDTTYYKEFELIKAFTGLAGFEPRISVHYLLDDNSSLKASFNKTRQYIHLISNTTSPTPVDLYRAAGRYIDPATVYQYAAGYYRNFMENKLEASAEIYYKDFLNLVDYRDGANLIFNEFIETELLSGIGRAYGAEFMLRKHGGKVSGWISYTLARSERKVESREASRTISNGKWYSANYDKLHDLSVVANYHFSEKWEAGMSFVYQTGRPITPPGGKYEEGEITVPIYKDRNSYRIPSYHRLDISATYTPKHKEGKKLSSSWNFGVYNLYRRRNPYSIFFRPQSENPDLELYNPGIYNTEAVRLSIFATAIPFVSWNFNF